MAIEKKKEGKPQPVQKRSPQETRQILEQRVAQGRSILKGQPVDKQKYEAWSESTRKTLAECYGDGAPNHKDFVTARRVIFTSFDQDPSYYLTQLVANLHREMKVLERCVNELPEPERPRPETAPRKASVLILCGRGREREKDIAGFLRSHGLEPLTASALIAPGKGQTDLRIQCRDSQHAVAVLVPEGEGPSGAESGEKGPRAAQNTILRLGMVIGFLGRSRVTVLHQDGMELPDLSGVQKISLKNAQEWQAKLAKALRAAGIEVRKQSGG